MVDDYSRYRKEIYCKHGVGHPAPWSEKSVHGCCGCCGKEEWEEKADRIKEELGNDEM